MVMCIGVGWVCVVDTPHDIKPYLFFIGTCSRAFFNILPARMRFKSPIADADVAREKFTGEKCKPIGKCLSKWLIADLAASPLLLLPWERATTFEDDKPRLRGNIYGWAVSNVGYFERDRDF